VRERKRKRQREREREIEKRRLRRHISAYLGNTKSSAAVETGTILRKRDSIHKHAMFERSCGSYIPAAETT
jgi:hypothetical protein